MGKVLGKCQHQYIRQRFFLDVSLNSIYPRNSHLCTKSAQKHTQLLIGTVYYTYELQASITKHQTLCQFIGFSIKSVLKLTSQEDFISWCDRICAPTSIFYMNMMQQQLNNYASFHNMHNGFKAFSNSKFLYSKHIHKKRLHIIFGTSQQLFDTSYFVRGLTHVK